MRLTFYGAAGQVTGSNHLLESGGHKLLIDCGMHQGMHYMEKENFEPFAYAPADIEAVIVTHAHLDHTGRLPKLIKDGFKGKVYSTPPTKDAAELLLYDSEHILRKEAEREHRESFCTEENVRELMQRWHEVPYHKDVTVGPFTIRFHDAGHVLGSAIARIEAEGKTIVFSGDLGNFPAPIVKPTELVTDVDYCVVESTYGDRLHDDVNARREMLEDVVEDTVKARGVLMIPAFALERTQELLYHLNQLRTQGRIPHVPVYIDSPLAIKLTAVYKKYEAYFNTETYDLVKSGDDIFNFPGLHLTLTTEQSKSINGVPPPKIVIAGAGMMNGGRILHHAARYLPDPRNTILFIGYQARGSLGRRIMEGASEVMIFGERVPISAKRHVISSYSAHADQARLLEWLAAMRGTVRQVFAVHGEEEASATFVQKIRDELAVPALVPKAGQSFEL